MKASHQVARHSAEYNRQHYAVRTRRGDPYNHDCVDCGKPAWEWSYVNGDRNDVNNYVARCNSCHSKHDYTEERRAKVQGENSPKAKLTSPQVLEIRRLHATGLFSQAEIAREYSMSPITIGNIIRRESWKHI